MNKIFRSTTKCLLLALGLLLSPYMQGQVTVGSGDAAKSFSVLEISTKNVQGGLRLPHLSTEDRTKLTSDNQEFKDEAGRPDGAALGLTIYNTTTNCIEYWDGYKWVSLCLGSADISFTDNGGSPTDPTQPIFPVEGGSKGPFFPKAAPVCDAANPPYAFMLMTGMDYTSINVIDPSTGKFTVTMDLNPTAASRTAILRVTDNCTSEYKEFIFSQEGDDAACADAVDVPDIKSSGTTELCQDGALYLYLDTNSTAGTFIWTLNGKEVGRGITLSVTEPGRYVVYSGLIGCTNSKEITITRGSDSAPSPVDFIVVGNNGVACSGEEVDLIVTNVPSGTIVWYKDGRKTALTGKQIKADKGDWFAVVEDAGCMSRPTATVTVIENIDGSGSVPNPEIKINGDTNPANWVICKAGIMYLDVDDPKPGITYSWYINNELKGTGNSLILTVPSTDEFVIRLRATGPGCAKEALTVQNVTGGEAPDAPFITTNTNDMLCGGKVTLIAINSPTATSYRWFKDGEEIAGTTASITVTAIGNYTVSAVAGGCNTAQSKAKTIGASDFATLSWGSSHPADVNVGETKTYSVLMDFEQGATYTWTVGGATLTNGKDTKSITVLFDVVGTATIKCEATNACGDAVDSPVSQVVTVSPECTNAQIKATSKLNPSVKVNKPVSMNVVATGTDLTYSWYKDGSSTPIPDATLDTYTFDGQNTATAPGTPVLFECRVVAASTCNVVATAQFRVTVTVDPEDLGIGMGSFSGKTCFDIAVGNGSGSCGIITSRVNQKTEFKKRDRQDPAVNSAAPYTGVQVYTFTPSGTVSNVRFEYADATGAVIEDLIPEGEYEGDNIKSACKVKVLYKASLDTELKDRTRATALKAELYVIYNDNANNTGTDKRLKLSMSFQDCACCGAKTVDGGWLTFMCHNLGADENLDPFVYRSNGNTVDGDIKGFLFQWGRRADGHQKRTSGTTYQLATNIEATLPVEVIGKFIVANTAGTPLDWLKDSGETSRWGNGSTDENMPKGVNDPCPAGWKVPSQKHWASIYKTKSTPNAWTWTGYGYKVGDALYLPAAGVRNNMSTIGGIGTYGGYWSSTTRSATSSYYLTFNGTQIDPSDNQYRVTAFSVRCVSE